MKQAIFVYVNHVLIRSWNQPILRIYGNVICYIRNNKKQREATLNMLGFQTDRQAFSNNEWDVLIIAPPLSIIVFSKQCCSCCCCSCCCSRCWYCYRVWSLMLVSSCLYQTFYVCINYFLCLNKLKWEQYLLFFFIFPDTVEKKQTHNADVINKIRNAKADIDSRHFIANRTIRQNSQKSGITHKEEKGNKGN